MAMSNPGNVLEFSHTFPDLACIPADFLAEPGSCPEM